MSIWPSECCVGLFIFIAVFPGFYAGPGGGHCPAQGQAPAKLRGEAEARGQRGSRVLLRGRVTKVRHVTCAIGVITPRHKDNYASHSALSVLQVNSLREKPFQSAVDSSCAGLILSPNPNPCHKKCTQYFVVLDKERLLMIFIKSFARGISHLYKVFLRSVNCIAV